MKFRKLTLARLAKQGGDGTPLRMLGTSPEQTVRAGIEELARTIDRVRAKHDEHEEDHGLIDRVRADRSTPDDERLEHEIAYAKSMLDSMHEIGTPERARLLPEAQTVLRFWREQRANLVRDGGHPQTILLVEMHVSVLEAVVSGLSQPAPN